MSDLLIIIPAYNEEGSIENVVNNIIQNYPQYDYVIINDGSLDRTSQICHENKYNIVDLPVNLMLMVNIFQSIYKVWKRKLIMVLIWLSDLDLLQRNDQILYEC